MAGRKWRRMRHCQMPLACDSSGTSMRTRYMWYSSGEVWPESTLWRASSVRRKRSSTACLVTISSTSQPADWTICSLPSAPRAYIALRWPPRVLLPSCGTSLSSMIDDRQVHQRAGKTAAFRHEAKQAVAQGKAVAAEQFVEHDEDRSRTGIAL